jgi:hypothetical protein
VTKTKIIKKLMELIISNEDVQFIENSTEIINQMVINNQ